MPGRMVFTGSKDTDKTSDNTMDIRGGYAQVWRHFCILGKYKVEFRGALHLHKNETKVLCSNIKLLQSISTWAKQTKKSRKITMPQNHSSYFLKLSKRNDKNQLEFAGFFHIKINSKYNSFIKMQKILSPCQRKWEIPSTFLPPWVANRNTEFIQKINCNHFSTTFQGQPFNFQGPPTTKLNIILQTVQKCTFPVYSDKTWGLELFASPTSLHFSVHLSSIAS